MISQLCCGLSTDQAVHWCCVSIHSRCVKQDATQPTDWWRPFGSCVLCLAQKRDTAWLLPELKMCPWRLWLECFRSGQISHQAIKRPTPSLFNMQYYGVFKGRQSELYLMTKMFYPPPPFLCLLQVCECSVYEFSCYESLHCRSARNCQEAKWHNHVHVGSSYIDWQGFIQLGQRLVREKRQHSKLFIGWTQAAYPSLVTHKQILEMCVSQQLPSWWLAMGNHMLTATQWLSALSKCEKDR